MKKSSSAYESFCDRLSEIEILLSLSPTSASTEIALQKQSAIIRSSIILLCSHFEAFFEELISEYIDFLNTHKVSSNKIPKSVKAMQVNSELNTITEILDFPKRVDRIDKLFQSYHILWTSPEATTLKSDYLIKDFNNPGSSKIKRLFRCLEIESIFDDVSTLFKKPDIGNIFKQTLDSVIAIRNRISHGEPTDCRQTMNDVKMYQVFFNAFALAVDKLIGRNLRKVSTIQPWTTAFNARRTQLKKLGFLT